MSNMKLKLNRSTLIFVVSYYVYLIASIWAQTAFKTVYGETIIDLFQWMAILLVVLKVVLDGTICKKNIPIWICFLLICILISITSTNYKYVIPIAAYVLAGSNINSETLIKTAFCAIVSMMIITVVSSLIGILPLEYTVSSDRMRYSMGFLYTTYLANYFFHALLMWLFIKKKCPNIVETLVILLINYTIYWLTVTRAVYYETIILMICCWIVRFIKKNIDESKLRFVFIGSYIVCAIFAIVIQINYDSNSMWMAFLNIILSYRLSLGHNAYSRYGISLFGQQVDWATYNRTGSTAYFYVDSSYLNIAINYGIIWLIVLLVCFTFLMKRYVKEKKIYRCLALLLLAIHSISDPQLYSLVCNPFLFLIGNLFPFTSMKSKERRLGLL